MFIFSRRKELFEVFKKGRSERIMDEVIKKRRSPTKRKAYIKTDKEGNQFAVSGGPVSVFEITIKKKKRRIPP